MTPSFRRRTLLGAFAAAPVALHAPWARAQQGSSLALVVTQVPGGASDFYARALTQPLAASQNLPAIVLNKPGAAGEIAATFVQGSRADGNTLLVGSSSVMVVSPQVRPTRYDARKDFRAVGGVVIADTVLVGSAKGNRWKTLADVVRLAKENPGKLSYASNGVGGAFHLAMEFFQSLAGVKLLHVPFNGASQGELAILSGQVDLMVTNTASALPHIRNGTLVALAVVGSAPSRELPEVPLGSAALPGFVANTWLATYGPAATPAAKVAELNTSIESYFKSPAGVEFLKGKGFIHVPSGPGEATAWTEAEYRTWGAIVAAAKKNGPIE